MFGRKRLLIPGFVWNYEKVMQRIYTEKNPNVLKTLPNI